MLELQIDTQVQHNSTKPIGETCNADGTLKDASKIKWLDSPSDETPPVPIPFSKCTHSVDFNDTQLVEFNSKRPQVSKTIC